jgi:UDP-glucose 4-epimerase
VFGDGSQIRDFVYVDDAVEAFLAAGATDTVNGEAFNVGGDEPISHKDLTTMLVQLSGSGKVRYVDWPPEQKAIDIGDFYADSTKFKLTTGWQASTPLRDGLKQTLAFYKKHLDRYVDPGDRTSRSAERV